MPLYESIVSPCPLGRGPSLRLGLWAWPCPWACCGGCCLPCWGLCCWGCGGRPAASAAAIVDMALSVAVTVSRFWKSMKAMFGVLAIMYEVGWPTSTGVGGALITIASVGL